MFRIVWLSFFIVISANANECKKAKWPYAKNQTKSDLHKIFQMNSIERNMSYLIYEVSQKKVSDLENYLFVYLLNTTKDKKIESFLEAVRWARIKEDKSINTINEKEFCELYKKTLNIK